MKRPIRRLLVTLVALVCLAVGVAGPASAGTLTGATFTAPSSWTSTGASGARYDWGFTTATTSTLSKVTATVPPGTGGKERFFDSHGYSGSWAYTPDTPANSVTGDIDIRAKATLRDWNIGSYVAFASKENGSGSRSYFLQTDGSQPGRLQLAWTTNGTTFITSTSSDVFPFSANGTGWVRATMDVNDGAGNKVITFYTSSDGTSWTQLGVTRTTAGTTSIFDSNAAVYVGSSALEGRIYYAGVRNGIDGTIVSKFDPNEAAPQSPTTWASSAGDNWTINRAAVAIPADIATELSVGTIEGLPTGGTATYRFVDGIASYYFPTATSVPSGTSVKLNLGGFTNTATPGSYASTIRTYNNTTIVDNATTAALAFTDTGSTLAATAVIEPYLTFTTAGRSSACNGATPTAGTSSTATAVNLGRLSSGGAIAAQNLSLSSNGASGAIVFARADGLSDGAGHTIPWITEWRAWNAAAFPPSTTPAMGYIMGWFANPDTYVGLLPSDLDILQLGSPASATQCIAFRAQPGSNTPAGTYRTSIVYTAVGRF